MAIRKFGIGEVTEIEESDATISREAIAASPQWTERDDDELAEENRDQ